MCYRQFPAGRGSVKLSLCYLITQDTKIRLLFVGEFFNRGNSVPVMRRDWHNCVWRGQDLFGFCGLSERQPVFTLIRIQLHVSCKTRRNLFLGANTCIFCCLVTSCLFIHIIVLPSDVVFSMWEPEIFCTRPRKYVRAADVWNRVSLWHNWCKSKTVITRTWQVANQWVSRVTVWRPFDSAL